MITLNRENKNYKSNQPVYVVRYTGDTGNYDIPYGKECGGTRTDPQPFTGNGYTGSKEHVVPEYVSNNNGTSISAGEIYRVYPDGTEEPVAFYNSKTQAFELYTKKGES